MAEPASSVTQQAPLTSNDPSAAASSSPLSSTTANASAVDANSTLDSHGRPAKKRSLVDVRKATTPINKELANDQPRRNSKRLPGRRRSSGASRRMQGTASGERGANLPPPVKTNPAERPKKSGVSKFFAILNCCKAPTDNNATEDDEAARKVERPSQSTQSTPPQKSEAGLKEKDSPDEKKQQAERAQQTATFPKSAVTTSEKKLPAAAKSDEPSDAKGFPAIPGEVLAQPSEKSNMDKPLPASPKSEEAAKSTPLTVAAGATGAAALAGVGVAAASKGNGSQTEKQPAEGVPDSKEEEVISDRTPEQARRDEDIEMKDIPPSVPIAPNEAAPIAGAEPTSQAAADASQHSNLPPPPPAPIPPPENQTQQNAAAESQATATEQADRKWLLPPIRPEMKGRKCLVLDLDETLVHSSFKVRVPAAAAGDRRAHFSD